MNEQFVRVNDDIELCYETFGDPSDPTVLLVMGLGTQMVAWHEDFCRAIVDRGFHVVLPGSVHAGAADTRPVVGPSRELGERIAGRFVRATGSVPSTYVGDGTGLVTRKDLGGLNLSTVPKVFIECGNMRDSADAALLTSGAWRQKAAQGISEGIVSFLRG